jgi:hypothetical protein
VQSFEVTIATAPNAKCTLSADAPSVSQKSMPVWADDTGIVHLWAPSAPETYSLTCAEPGGPVTHSLNLADAAIFTPAIPRAAAATRVTLPALTDPSSPTQADLVKAGYPPRPDPVLAAPLYEQWLRIVSAPTTLVSPSLVERADVHFDSWVNRTSNFWGGLALNVAGRRYAWSLGTFTVPAFSPNGQANSNAAMWAGLDEGPDIIQDGVDYASVGSVGSYSAWYEYFPNPPVFNSNMTIAAGDSVTFWAWEGDAACVNGAGHTGRGCFWYKNNTRNTTFGTQAVVAPNGSFTGSSAESIIERARIVHGAHAAT